MIDLTGSSVQGKSPSGVERRRCSRSDREQDNLLLRHGVKSREPDDAVVDDGDGPRGDLSVPRADNHSQPGAARARDVEGALAIYEASDAIVLRKKQNHQAGRRICRCTPQPKGARRGASISPLLVR